MARVNLKSIIGRQEISEMVNAISVKTSVCIKDAAGTILLGKENDKNNFEFPVKIAEEIIGHCQRIRNDLQRIDAKLGQNIIIFAQDLAVHANIDTLGVSLVLLEDLIVQGDIIDRQGQKFHGINA